MREVFKGWRRKVGCVTLVMALILTGGWMRSGTTVDFFEIRLGKYAYRIGSMGGTLKLIRGTQFPSPSEFKFWQSREFEARYMIPWQDYEVIEWRWDFADLHFGTGQKYQGTIRTNLFAVPYRYVIWPLTLLSAYLLLWKPRKRTGAEHA